MADTQFLTVDGRAVAYEAGANVLSLAKKAGVDIPAFCYQPELSVYGACRMCLVEVIDAKTGRGALDSSCSLLAKPGMVIKTNTDRLRHYRKVILELLLANHCRDCTTCDNNQRCRLQEFADRYGISGVRFPQNSPEPVLDASSACITRDQSKCILCGCCIRMCNEIQGVGAIDFAHRGSEMTVACVGEKPIGESVCVGCGQCAAVCPTGALVVKNDVSKIWKAIDDKKFITTVQIAPAVRVAVGNAFGIPASENTFGKMVSALRLIGFDEVYDTSTSADLTIWEEAAEFLERLKTKPKMPLFTSCCPAWIQFVEKHHPDIMPNVSTSRSPMQMFASIFRAENDKAGRNVFHVAVMPCTAKKYEAARDEFKVNGKPNVDAVLTTQELVRMIKESGIDYKNLAPEAVEDHYGTATGAGVIFGVSGGVTEAVLRFATPNKTPVTFSEIALTGVRGLEGVKTATAKVGGAELKIAVVNGLANASAVIERIKNGEHFDFVEVMACPGGCIGGGGQPVSDWSVKEERSKGLYLADKEFTLASPEQNPAMKEMYGGVLKDKAHELLHVHYPLHRVGCCHA